MLPSLEQAHALLIEAEVLNPGPWGDHSRVAAQAAQKIALACGMDGEKAYVLGLLHDIGRRFGVSHFRHVWDGYCFLNELGYDEPARICLTHSFSGIGRDEYIGSFDVPPEVEDKVFELLENIVFDDYDRLIQLCDSLAMPQGVVDMDVRMDDVARRYGRYPEDKRVRKHALKAYFEKKAGKNLYEMICEDRTLWGR